MKRKFLCPACGKKFSLYQMPDHLDSCPDRKHYNQHLALFRDLDEYRNQCYMEAEIEMKLMPYVQHLIGCPERGGKFFKGTFQVQPL